MTDLDALDRALLDRLQVGFPLVPRPFAALGQELGLAESEVLARTRRIKGAGIIRQIGAILDTRRLGYQSTLVAFHTSAGLLEEVAARVSAHPGVSHNYARSHHYNLWFTLAVPPGRELVTEIEGLARQTGVEDWLNLPALRVFKIQTRFRLGEDHAPQTGDCFGPNRGPGYDGGQQARDAGTWAGSQPRSLVPDDIPFVRALQQDLPLVPRPFAQTARQFGLSEEALLARARVLEAAGIMRRFSAVLRHRQVGYTANGMACWIVPEARIEVVGQRAAQHPRVSHCYQRPAYPPRWPYNLFTMIHGQTRDRVEEVVGRIAQETGLDQTQVLYSTREFKKERVRYFEEET